MEKKFSIELPKEWDKDIKTEGAIMSASHSKDVARVDITDVNLPKNASTTIEDLINLTIEANNLQLTEKGHATVAAQDAMWFKSSSKGEGQLLVLQYAVPRDEKYYILMFTTTISAFPAYKNTFEKIVGSFRFE